MNHERATERECDVVEPAREWHRDNCAAKERECDSVLLTREQSNDDGARIEHKCDSVLLIHPSEIAKRR